VLAQTFGRQFDSCREAISRSFVEIGIGPNVLTMAGFVFTLACALCIGKGWLGVAFVLIIFAGACDMLDGAVARAGAQGTRFGAVLDSTVDRYSDTVLYLGILYYFMFMGENGNAAFQLLTVLAMAGSMATSYVRARAEGLVKECRAGFWERGERIAYILIGLGFNHLKIVVFLLAIFTNVTVLQRLLYTRWELARQEKKPVWPHSEWLADLLFWNYDRGAWQYDAAVVVFFAVAILVRW
jgi:CDP-diacylglycerol--glycerol-3-phosphate 3-phosphatidyltransferase